MERRKYIYLAIPLFALLGSGRALEGMLGGLGALIVATVVLVAAWGVVWLRLYRMGRLRPEFAVLSVLPQGIYFAERQLSTNLIAQSPACQNLYALTWLGFIGVAIASIRPTKGDAPAPLPPMRRDPLSLLMVPIICAYAVFTFVQYYTTLTSL